MRLEPRNDDAPDPAYPSTEQFTTLAVASPLASRGIQWGGDLPKLFTALAKAQVSLEGAIKNSVNPAFKRDGKPMGYADLAAVMDVVRASYPAQGIAVVQCPLVEGQKVSVTTIITHQDGGWMSSTMSCMAAGATAQAVGAAVTYLKRYGASAMLAVVADADDDGNAASGVNYHQAGAMSRSAPMRDEPNRAPPASEGPDEDLRRRVMGFKGAITAADNIDDAMAAWRRGEGLLGELPETTREHLRDAYERKHNEPPPAF